MGESEAGRRIVSASTADVAWIWHCGDLWRAHVMELTGADICDVVGPSPRSARAWVATMRRLSVRGLSGVVSAVHGPSVPSRRAMRGDLVRRGWALGICRGDRAVFLGGDVVAMKEIDEAWRLQASRHAGPQCLDQGFPAKTQFEA